MLDAITPIVLTYNEQENIRRSLEHLQWAREVVVMDSHSSDETVSIVRSFPNTRLLQRTFDSFAHQWNFAMEQCPDADWVLALDADYVVSEALRSELEALRPEAAVMGYQMRVDYCVYGQRLRGSLYPPVIALFRKSAAVFRQDGHAYRVAVRGDVRQLRQPILHDDRKPLGRWLRNQALYMEQEAAKLESGEGLSRADRIRKLRVVAPFAAFLYALLAKGAILDGRAGWHYAFQRLVAEGILSLKLLEHDVKRVISK